MKAPGGYHLKIYNNVHGWMDPPVSLPRSLTHTQMVRHLRLWILRMTRKFLAPVWKLSVCLHLGLTDLKDAKIGNSLLRVLLFWNVSLSTGKKTPNIRLKSVDSYKAAETCIIRAVQQKMHVEEISCWRSSQNLPRNSSILSLNHVLDDDGILRVGGRLKNNASADVVCALPILIPGKHYIATLLIVKCHQSVRHQGRYFTEGKVISSGYWITGCRRLVVSIMHKCVICRRMRRQCES